MIDYCDPPPSAIEWHEPEPSWSRRTRFNIKKACASECLVTAELATNLRTGSVRPLNERFSEQAEKWFLETSHLSSPAQMMMHPSYQAILGMADENKKEVVRLMLNDLKAHRRMWFWALSYLTRENPIKTPDAGHMDKMIEAWVAWGQQSGIL
jgi:hypothetical protein